MAQYTAKTTATGQSHCKLFEYKNDDTGSTTFTLGTDTLSTAGIAVGDAREIGFEVREITACVGTVVIEGTYDPAQAEWFGVSDATSGSNISVDVSSAESITEVLQPLLFVRARLTTNTSGTASFRFFVKY